jgi:hypothetical protein
MAGRRKAMASRSNGDKARAIHARSATSFSVRTRARRVTCVTETSKSFLVLFFKKEHFLPFSSSMRRQQVEQPMRPRRLRRAGRFPFIRRLRRACRKGARLVQAAQCTQHIGGVSRTSMRARKSYS